jgi:hypothetical protein
MTDILNGTVTLTYTSNNPVTSCNAVSDFMVVTINQAATVTVGADQTICSTETVVLDAILGGSASSGSWTSSSSGSSGFNNANAANTVYTPSATDLSNGFVTLTFTTNDPDGGGPCSTVSDDLLVTINTAPTLTISSDATICSTETYTLSAAYGGGATGGTWTTSGSGTFDDANLTNATYTPSSFDISNGSVVLTFTTNAPTACDVVDESMTLTLKREVAITSQPVNTGVCNTDPTTLNVTAEGLSIHIQIIAIVEHDADPAAGCG